MSNLLRGTCKTLILNYKSTTYMILVQRKSLFYRFLTIIWQEAHSGRNLFPYTLYTKQSLFFDKIIFGAIENN